MEFGSLEALLAWLAVFYALVALYYSNPEIFKKMGLEATPFALIIRRGYRFDFVDRLSPGTRRILRALFTLGAPALIAAMIMFYDWIIRVTLARIAGSVAAPAIIPIIPGVTVSLSFFLQLLPALGLAALIHEAFHGIAARLEGIPVRSTGFMMLLGIIPAAFVEPLEEAFKRARLISKLRVLSAGVAGNLILALLAASLLAVVPASAKLVITGFTPGSPAEKAGLKKGDVILYANSTPVTNITILRHIISESRVVNLTVDRSGRLVSLLIPVAEKGGKRYIGIYVSIRVPPLQEFLSLLYLVNLSLALVNAAPLVITDGGQVVSEVLARLGKSGRVLSIAIQAVTVGLLLANIGLLRIG